MRQDPLDMRYKRRDDVCFEEVAGETIVLDETHGHVHQLNASASFVWNNCDGDLSVRDIVCRLTERFDVEASIAHGDVVEVIDRLKDLELIGTLSTNADGLRRDEQT